MAKFKKGDRVRCIKGWDYFRLFAGSEYIIDRVEDCEVALRELPGTGTFIESRFQLVAPAEQSELEELVATANAGFEALDKLRALHPNNVEVQNANDEKWRLIGAWGEWSEVRYRIKQTPAFEPFTVGQGWRVELDGGMLRIGCQSFVPDVLRSYLIDLCDRNALSAGNLSATRTGVAMEGTPHSISWDDADRLLAALRKAGA
jgi:hypothetical protein